MEVIIKLSHSYFVLDNYIYKKDKVYRECGYYRCVHHECGGRAKSTPDGAVAMTKLHTHEASFEEVEKLRFMHFVTNRAAETTAADTTMRDIFQEAGRLHPQGASATAGFTPVRRSMGRSRRTKKIRSLQKDQEQSCQKQETLKTDNSDPTKEISDSENGQEDFDWFRLFESFLQFMVQHNLILTCSSAFQENQDDQVALKPNSCMT